MKKLIALAAVAACGAAIAAVESPNIVGYNTKAVSGYKFVGADFINCDGTEGMTLGDLKTNCDLTGEIGTGWQALADSVVQLDENGTFVRKLVFLPGYIASEFSAEEGWYDNDAAAVEDFSTCLNDEPITFGKGIQVSADAGASVQFMGQVKNAPTVTDVEGYMIIANCAPKTLELGDLQTNCDLTGEIGTGWQALADSVVLLDENGTFVRKLVFLPGYIASEFSAEEGWYDNDAAAVEDFTSCWNDLVSWEPGEGFQVSADAGATITIKSALAAE